MSGSILSMFVPGECKPQGSMTPIRTPSGRTFMKPAGGNAFTMWRNAVIDRASQCWPAAAAPWNGPVTVTVIFGFDRPKNHCRTGRNAHILRDAAPLFPVTGNDCDKLCRTIGDALQIAGVIADDALIVSWRADKVYGPPGAWIAITEAGPPPVMPASVIRFPQQVPAADQIGLQLAEATP